MENPRVMPHKTSVKKILTAVKHHLTAVKSTLPSKSINLESYDYPHSPTSNKLDPSGYPHSPTSNNIDSSNTRHQSREHHVTSKLPTPTKYIQRTLNKVQISVSSSKYIQRTLSKGREILKNLSSKSFKRTPLRSIAQIKIFKQTSYRLRPKRTSKYTRLEPTHTKKADLPGCSLHCEQIFENTKTPSFRYGII